MPRAAVIGSYAFRKCGKHFSVSIPSSVTTIGADAFSQAFADKNGEPLESSAKAPRGYRYVAGGDAMARVPVGGKFSAGNLEFEATASAKLESARKAELSGYAGAVRPWPSPILWNTRGTSSRSYRLARAPSAGTRSS